MDGGALMQVNLCPKSNNGQASCSVLTESDNQTCTSESQAVVKLDQTITAVCPLNGQVALITNPPTTPALRDDASNRSPVLKRKYPQFKDVEDDCKESKKNKLWLQENMSKAIDAVCNGMHIRTASKLFSVPRTTLKYKLASSDAKKDKPQDNQTTSTDCFSSNNEVIETSMKDNERSVNKPDDIAKRLNDVTKGGMSKTVPGQCPRYVHILPSPVYHEGVTMATTTVDRLKFDKNNHNKNKEPKKKCKLWSEETMNEAVEAVCKGSKIKDAAVFYGVPMSTLGNRVLVRKRKDASKEVTAATTVDTSAYIPILPTPPNHHTSSHPVTKTTVVTTNRPVTLATNKPQTNPGKLRGKIKQWSEESMEKALRALNEEGLSVYAAAKKYNVPKSTLDAKKKKREYNTKGTRSVDIIINPEDEYPLVSYVNICARFGITNIKNVVLLLAAEKAENRGRWDIKEQGILPDAWWEGFLDRCARLIKNVDITHHPFRLTEARLGLFFDKLIAIINSSQYHKTPLTDLDQRTFTVQEFCFKGTGSGVWVYDDSFTASRGSSNSTTDYSNDSCYSSASSSNDDNNDGNDNHTNSSHSNRVSSLCCVNASGTSLRPLFVVHTSQSDYKVHQAGPDQVIVHDVNDQSRCSDYYYTWFNDVFIKHAHQLRPVILLLDPDTSFITPEFIALANKHHIILLCLPPLSTRMTQPLYTAVLPALQQGLKTVQCNAKGISDCSEFPSAFTEAWKSSVDVDVIKTGFHKSGIYPLNRKVFDHLDLPVV